MSLKASPFFLTHPLFQLSIAIVLNSAHLYQVLPLCMDHVEHWEVFLPDVTETTPASLETVAQITVMGLLWDLMLRNTSGKTSL